MIRPLFFGSVSEQGTLILGDPSRFKAYLLTLKGKEVQVLVKPYQKTRSTAENNYYWGVIVALVAEEMGLIPDETHDYLKSLFLKMDVEIKSKRYEVVRSTALLSTEEFEFYAEKCRQWASAELNIYIPIPNEIEWEVKGLINE